ncbi:MAG: VOC family protein [Cyclobacteriaceae bacterium]
MTITPHYPVITPYLIVDDASALISFLKNVFGAEVRSSQNREDSETIMHAEVTIGEGLVMITNTTEEFSKSPAVLYIYLDEVDSYYEKAMSEGATSMEEPGNQEYGHRRAAFNDGFGNQWWVASPIQAK